MKLKKIMKSIFFWKKKGNPEIPEAERMLQLYLKYIPQLRKVMNGDENPFDGNYFKRMYDFWADWDDVRENVTVIPFDQQGDEVKLIDDKRKEATPLSVVKELEHIPVPFDLMNIHRKILMFKSKSKLVAQKFTRDQIEGFIQRLENRKHYLAHKDFFEKFPSTNDEKIDNLVTTYKLVLKKAELFVPTFPQEAIDVMEEYADRVHQFTDEKCVFYVIAEAKDFKKKYKKLDPILLVQSPFGFYWQILGAWDKEMLLLSEL